MSGDLTIRCACGTLRGRVQDIPRRETNRVVCYCDDCQAFAHYLGRAAEVLDPHGGTEVVQMSPAYLEIAEGADELRALRLTVKGTLRWYTACCRTPVGNTLATDRLPFLGLITACVEGGAGQDALDLALGPIRGRVWGRYAKGDTTGLNKLYPGPPVWMMMRLAGLMLKWRLRGDHRNTPFFDQTTHAPVTEPHVLTDAERASVLNARDGVKA